MKRILWIVITLIILLAISFVSFFIMLNDKNGIKNIYINDNDKIVIELVNNDKTYCYIGNKYDSSKWILSKENICILDYVEDNNYIYLKNKYGNITKISNKYNLSSIKKFNITNNKIYLALGGSEQINYYLDSIVDKKDKIIFKSLDETIATVDKNGLVVGKNVGNTNISITLDNYNINVNVIVTDKIVTHNSEFDYKKKYIRCNEYTKEDNDLLDEILASRISKVGKSTRAAVVEAARFLTLEFPRKISYFGENGRLTYPNQAIDGEGRFYKEGLFLNESRYTNIKKSMYGPGTWGCVMYSYPNQKSMPNGLDCSGFVSWVFINAGFDVGDIGAGVTPEKDFTDIGEKKYIKDSVDNNLIIVGDLLSGYGAHGGHIAIVAGIKDGNYYIAESLGHEGVVLKKYDAKKLKNTFYWHVDMNNFYTENGELTNYWLN